MKKTKSMSIQKNILLLTLLITLILGISIAFFASYYFTHSVKSTQIQSAETSLRYTANRLEYSLDSIFSFVSYCQFNDDVVDYVMASPNNNTLKVKAYANSLDECQKNQFYIYFRRYIITHGVSEYLSYRGGDQVAMKAVFEVLKTLPIDDLLASPREFPMGIIKDPFYKDKQSNVLLITQPIYSKYNASVLGFILVEISENLILDCLKDYYLEDDSVLYITIGNSTYHYDSQSNLLQEIELVTDPRNINSSINTIYDTTTIYSDHSDDSNFSSTIIETPLENYGIRVYQKISEKSLLSTFHNFIVIISCIILGVALLCFAYAIYLNRLFQKHIRKLNHRMQLISYGDFTKDLEIEWSNEFGLIGKGINNLSESIAQLTTTRIEAEHEKADIEYRMLQNQINPHFLYNALNSIKWMATIQHADGICEMTVALSRLLKDISKGTGILVPLENELSLLNDYFTIQSYRYGGAIQMNYYLENEDLRNCTLPRFSLQPLVENAIFHGIEPNGGTGSIKIIITEPIKGLLQIDVTDDGIGIDDETKVKLLQFDNTDSTHFFKQLGIANIHKRIQYEYGNAYGLTIQSKLGVGTTITLRIPCQRTKIQ